MKRLLNIIGENSLEHKPYKLDKVFEIARDVTWKDAIEKINQGKEWQ